ncbi:PfkB family carbohydrate kinase [Nocardia sp. alder85J]|uniref:PfkB family carbohydrate kinase n=1 Tax=Nocardia sp. alder85J TaxID=2862949 RepID=UPI001CD47806|nr:PfkB family carbohydrate kinase [Nocardia sp. alder85J]MCX4092893.1 PfkB family carbohydrate kinase [Nocardia sp. alder85J]
MTGDEAAIAAVRSVLTSLRKRAGLQPDRLHRTEIDAGILLDLPVIQRYADRFGRTPQQAVLPVVRELARGLSPTDRLIVDSELNLELLQDLSVPDVDLARLYGDDLGPRRTYLCEQWEALHHALSADRIPPAPTVRSLRGAHEDRAFHALARRLVEPSIADPVQILVVGDAVHDHVYHVDHIPAAGRSVDGHRSAHPGGKGLGRAVVVAGFGASAGLVGAVGGDEAGRLLLSYLGDHGVDTSLVKTVVGASTPIVVVIAGPGEPVTFVDKNDQMALDTDDLAGPAVQNAIGRAKVLLLTFEQPEPVLAWVLAHVHTLPSRPTVIVHASPRLKDPQTLYPFLHTVDYLIGTAAELGSLLLGSGSTTMDPAQWLQVMGARTVCTIREFGCAVRTRDESYDVAPYPAVFRSKPGANAVFSAALAYRVLHSGGHADKADFAWATAAMDIAPLSLSAVPDPLPTVDQVDQVVRFGPVGEL